MTALVIGGSGSGKSAWAEDFLCRRCGKRQKYYIATMQVFGEEGQKKVERHRRMREGKGFLTIEQPLDIERAAAGLRREDAPGRAALLECVSNLAANEMFGEEGEIPCERVVERIVRGIGELERQFSLLVIVTNNVFEDGILYGASTLRYMEALGQINERLAKEAELVTEVSAGIPLVWKGAAQ
ncbi:MAG: bifunctional adenosylcobinamide kinase/adenosylcobinamide-phosphate guanylyltransferase [Eubacteriales bacterium]|nr:bifunctional adenosylcobinamide kinase/adenosylcobinamide-phosphate guanylyltransferase [Eubacteriales bacterium]